MLKKIIAVVIFLTLNVIVLTGTYLNKQKFGAMPQELSAHVPDFSWQDESGGTHAIRELVGKVVVIHFWASWCGPCRREFPDLLEAAKAAGSDVVFLTISGDDNHEEMKKFLARTVPSAAADQPANVIYAYDADRKIAGDIFQTEAYPETIIVDKTGKMRRKFVGEVDWTGKEAVPYLKSFDTQPSASGK